MKTGLKPGLEQELTRVVTREMCVRGMRGMPPVLATAEMIRLMEITAHLLLQPFYEEEETSVGTHVDVRHTAATPVGLRVRTTARLSRIEGRRCWFEVAAFDEREPIGHGVHERFVIDLERFRERHQNKLA